MLRFARALLLLALVTCGASGCDSLAAPGSAPVIVTVVDEDGRSFTPDRAWWYYPPEGGTVEEFDAACINLSCTRWAVDDRARGLIYVAASYSRPYPHDPYCFYHAFDAAPVEVRAGETRRVTLELEILLGCE